MDVASEFYEGTYRLTSLNITHLIAFACKFLLHENREAGGNKCNSGSLPESASRKAQKSERFGDRGLSSDPVLVLNISIIA